jgi:triosephosphate isomerase
MNYFIANWKMNMSLKDIIPWLDVFSKLKLNQNPDRHIVICPSFPHLSLLKEVSGKIGFEVGAQDLSVFEKGAHTGETGNFQLKGLANYCIVGHSERKETLDTVIIKRDLCLKTGITPLACFVEKEDSLKLETKETILCWEDPSNISRDGVYREKNTLEIAKGMKEIKEKLSKDTIVIYGGSVNRENIKSLNEIKEIDGVLVGNASLDPNHFADIINTSI